MVIFLTHARWIVLALAAGRGRTATATQLGGDLRTIGDPVSQVVFVIASVRPSPRSCVAAPRRNVGATSPDRRPRGGESTAECQTEDTSIGCTQDGRVAHATRPDTSPTSALRPRTPGASPSPALEGQLHVEDYRRRALQNCVPNRSERASRPITRCWP